MGLEREVPIEECIREWGIAVRSWGPASLQIPQDCKRTSDSPSEEKEAGCLPAICPLPLEGSFQGGLTPCMDQTFPQGQGAPSGRKT